MTWPARLTTALALAVLLVGCEPAGSPGPSAPPRTPAAARAFTFGWEGGWCSDPLQLCSVTIRIRGDSVSVATLAGQDGYEIAGSITEAGAARLDRIVRRLHAAGLPRDNGCGVACDGLTVWAAFGPSEGFRDRFDVSWARPSRGPEVRWDLYHLGLGIAHASASCRTLSIARPGDPCTPLP